MSQSVNLHQILSVLQEDDIGEELAFRNSKYRANRHPAASLNKMHRNPLNEKLPNRNLIGYLPKYGSHF